MSDRVVWVGEIEDCQLCKKPLGKVMIDGIIKVGQHQPWANVCEPCHDTYGLGLGTGRGQRYEWDETEKAWIKTGG